MNLITFNLFKILLKSKQKILFKYNNTLNLNFEFIRIHLELYDLIRDLYHTPFIKSDFVSFNYFLYFKLIEISNFLKIIDV